MKWNSIRWKVSASHIFRSFSPSLSIFPSTSILIHSKIDESPLPSGRKHGSIIVFWISL